MGFLVAFTYYTSKKLVDAYTYTYSSLKEHLGLSAIARTVNDYNIVENLNVNDARDFFADSEVMYPFLCTARGRRFLKSSAGFDYLNTKEGTEYRRRYGYRDPSKHTDWFSGFEYFPKLIVENEKDYDMFRILWEPSRVKIIV